ncbi:MAG: sensor histidine kinase [Sphingobacteriaceae bacterium]
MINKIILNKLISNNSKKVSLIIGIIIFLFQTYWFFNEYNAKKFQILTEVETAFNASIMSANMKILSSQLGDFLLINNYSLKLPEKELNAKSKKIEIRIEFDTTQGNSSFNNKSFQKMNVSDTTFYNGLEMELKSNLKKIDIDLKFKTFTESQKNNLDKTIYPDTISPKYSWFKTNKKIGLLLSGVKWQTLLKMKYSIILMIIFLLLVLTTIAFLSAAIKKNIAILELKKNFTNSMTHELKTPLSTIAVAIESLEKYNGMDDKELTKEYLGIMKLETNRLIEMVNSILVHSKLNESEIVLKIETIKANQLFLNCIDLMKPKLDNSKGVIKINSNEIEFEGDTYHLSNVIMNLIDNALKYSNKQPIININCDIIQNMLHINFSDNGIGVSPKYKDRIFDAYFRIHEDDLYIQKGFGLGLSYVKEIITLHKGSIELMEDLNQGTCFLIKLPLQWKV